MMPAHSHITPTRVFFIHRNHSKETIIHMIDKIRYPILLDFIAAFLSKCKVLR